MRLGPIIISVAILLGPFTVAEAQSNVTTVAPSVEVAGRVDILVEADTYTPAFYRGRAEPTSGQPLTLIAVPTPNIADRELTYNWKVNGRSLPETGPAAKITGPLGSSFTAHVTVTSQGQALAQNTEIIALSDPELLIYEMNALRGRSATAIIGEYNLIGSEAEFAAVPYFTETNIHLLRGNWEIDGQTVATGDDWRTIAINRPETPNPRYTVELEVTSPSGFMKRITNLFYVKMGL